MTSADTTTTLAERARQIVASWPALTDAQRARLRVLLRTSTTANTAKNTTKNEPNRAA